MFIVLFIVGIAGSMVQVHPASAAEPSSAIEVIEDLESDPDAILAAGATPSRRWLWSIAPPRSPRPPHAPAAPPPVPPPER